MSTHALTIDGFLPVSTNDLARMHWSVRARIMGKDGQLVATLAQQQGVPLAQGRRRVSITCYQPKGRPRDPDNILKGLLDHLTAAGLIRDDSQAWCELGEVRVEQGARRTVVVLEDME